VALIWVRVAIGAAVLLALLHWRGHIGQLRAHMGPVAVVGVLNSALPFVLLAYATLSVTAGFAGILNATAPLWAALVAYVWLHQRLSLPRLLGLGLGFAGVLVLAWGKLDFKPGGEGLAVVAALVATLLYGIAGNYTRERLQGVPPLLVAAGSQVAATATLLPFLPWAWPQEMPNASAWWAAGTLGVACTGLAYVLYFRLIARVGTAGAMSVTYLVPVFAIVWGGLFLGEPLTGRMLAGGLVVALGVALSTGLLAPRGKAPA
jgi:drug/metabolite transporter (DMT)-like permease